MTAKNIDPESGLEAAEAEHHCRVIRDLLQRDYLSKADWTYALNDLADLAKEALRARQTLEALYNPETAGWTPAPATARS